MKFSDVSMAEVQRPLDSLNLAKGKRIIVELKGGAQYTGKLEAFDIHINIVLSGAEQLENGAIKRKIGRVFIRGDTIVLISASE